MNGKILAAAALAGALAIGMCACGSSQPPSGSASAPSVAQFSTMEEVLASYNEQSEWEYDDAELMYSATDGDNYIRVWADMTPEVDAALEEAISDFTAQKEALSPLAVKKQEVYAVPSQSEVDSALVGKTGAELVSEGYSLEMISMSGPDSTGVGISKAPYIYTVTFEGHVDDMDTPDIEGAVSGFKVTEAEVTGLSRPEGE